MLRRRREFFPQPLRGDIPQPTPGELLEAQLVMFVHQAGPSAAIRAVGQAATSRRGRAERQGAEKGFGLDWASFPLSKRRQERPVLASRLMILIYLAHFESVLE